MRWAVEGRSGGCWVTCSAGSSSESFTPAAALRRTTGARVHHEQRWHAESEKLSETKAIRQRQQRTQTVRLHQRCNRGYFQRGNPQLSAKSRSCQPWRQCRAGCWFSTSVPKIQERTEAAVQKLIQEIQKQGRGGRSGRVFPWPRWHGHIQQALVRPVSLLFYYYHYS